MTTLESYLTDGILQDNRDISVVEAVLHETAATIAATFDETQGHWPYEAIRGPIKESTNFSLSTNAMMIHAVDLLSDGTTQSTNNEYPFYLDAKIQNKLATHVSGVKEKVIKDIKSLGMHTHSKTYGNDDPISMSFLGEIYALSQSKFSDISNLLSENSDRFLDIDPDLRFSEYFTFSEGEGSVPLSNAFVPLRVIRTRCLIDGGARPEYRKYLRYFESTLHDQLSFISIPDSRFDPAELTFCLEGMLLASRSSVDTALFRRVLDVLGKAQESSAHWRPAKPFLRNERGMVLFPLSVETANALVRSYRLLETDRRYHGFTGDVVHLLRRFWEWLTARRLNIPADDGRPDLWGWDSEHIADPNAIQLWGTAQVVEFLLAYRRLLHLHIARTTLRLSRFDVRMPSVPDFPWSETTRNLQHTKADTQAVSEGTPKSIISQFEPATTLGPYFETYRRLGGEFIEGWLTGRRKNYSMLLYGPPGTGKTNVAENIANALQFPLITITVSDFLAEGGGAVEARAKMIFQVLEAQADCVILFDEIDELLLDRGSERHRIQDTVFKFMTPGMLTKFANLRRQRRVIFILATNYAFRIDPAIRRTGRIDTNYLLLPPDVEARERMLEEQLAKQVKSSDALHPTNPKKEKLKTLAKEALFLGYKDIETAVSRLGSSSNLDNLLQILKGWARTTLLESYPGAYAEVYEAHFVDDEFLPLLKMQLQEHGKDHIEYPIKNRAKKNVYKNMTEAKKEAIALVSKRNLEYGGGT